MKFLFCGLGSIGERHLANLLALGEHDIIAYRKIHRPLRSVSQKIFSFNSLDKALAQKPEVAFITNPTSEHMKIALSAANAGCHLFIEKPLSHSFHGVDKLQKIITQNKLIVQIGFMMRFHPAIQQIKLWLDEKIIGTPLSIRAVWGEYLPIWHSWEDYQKSYAGKKFLGGGPINTLCHDFDLLYWFFGVPKMVFALQSSGSEMQIDTEHAAEILLEFKKNVIASVHLDYLQNPPTRTWQIIGSRGKIEYDYYSGILNCYINQANNTYKKIIKNYSGFQRNELFVIELKQFLNAIKQKKPPNIDLEDGIINIKIITSIHQSIKSKKPVYVKL